MNIPLSPCVPESLVSRDGFSRPVPRQPAHLHTQAESVCMVSTYVQQRSMDQPRMDMVAYPARGQLNREHEFSPVPVRAGEFGFAKQVRPSRVSLLVFHTQLSWLCTLGIPPAFRDDVTQTTANGSVMTWDRAIAYRWCSLHPGS